MTLWRLTPLPRLLVMARGQGQGQGAGRGGGGGGNQRLYCDVIEHLCRPSRSLVAACMQRDTAGKSPLDLACELPTKGVLHAMLGAAQASAPEHPLWSYNATFSCAGLRDAVSEFIGGSETSLRAGRSVACQTTLRGCWCCTRCKNCLQGRPCVEDSR